MNDTANDGANPVLAEVWRGEFLECVHRGAAVVATASGEIVEAWGDPARVILPRSSCKIIQALPLIESGAAEAAGLGTRQLALACASHQGMEVHTTLAARWLGGLGMGESDLRCGVHLPKDADTRYSLRRRGVAADQFHNNCSGKHCGFLTVSQHLGGSADYIDPTHPVQQAVRQATEEVTGETVRGFAIDGCSAPNFAISIGGLATAMARFATPEVSFTSTRAAAALRLREAMAAHPELVAGERNHVTELIRTCRGRAVVKGGAEGMYVAMLPEKGLGIALKIDDGAKRGTQAAIAALLARYGALERADPVYGAMADAPILNCRGIAHGHLRAAETLLADPVGRT
jgi:L-asparaginase II